MLLKNIAATGLAITSLTLGLAWSSEASAAQPDLALTYQKMIESDPYDAYALRRLLEVTQGSGGAAELVGRYEERVARTPTDAVAWTLLGHLYRAMENPTDAVAALERAGALRERDHRPWVAIAEIWRHAQRWEPTLRAYETALERARSRDARSTILEDAAEAALEGADKSRALAWLERYRALDSRSVLSAMNCAEMLSRFGHNDEALEAWAVADERARGALAHQVVIWRHVGALYEEMGRLDDAEANWRRALSRTPARHWALSVFQDGLVRVYRRRDQLADLAAEWSKIAQRKPQFRASLAVVYDELGDDDLALTWLARAISHDRHNLKLHERRIALMRRRGDTAAVVRAYEELIRSAPREARYGLDLVEELFRTGLLTRAMKRLDRVTARHRRDPGVWQRSISMLMRYGAGAEEQRVTKAYRTLIKLEPREPAHLVSLGEALWARGDRKGAMATWRRLERIGGRPGVAELLLAEVFVDHGLHGDAAKAFDTALERAPENASVLEGAARWFEARPTSADRKRAAEIWTRLLDLGADARVHPRAAARRGHARRHLVDLWERDHSIESRLERLSAQHAAAPDDVPSGLLLAELLLLLSRLEEAERVLDDLGKRAPEHVEILELRVTLLLKTHRLQEAMPLLRRVAALAPRSADRAIHKAAELAHALGDDDRALELSEEALRLHPGDAAAHLRAGELRLRLGDREAAAQAWREALRLNPRDDELRMRLASVYRDLGDAMREERALADVVRDASVPARIQRAGRRLLVLARQHDRLPFVERLLRPLAAAQGRRAPLHRRLLIDLILGEAEALVWAREDVDDDDERLMALGTRGLESLLVALVDDDAALRSRSIRAIRLTRPVGAVPALGRLMEEGDGSVQFQAAVTLGIIGSPSAIPALGRALAEGTPDLQRAAIWALGCIPDARARALLLERTDIGHARHHDLVAVALAHHPHAKTVRALDPIAIRDGSGAALASQWALAVMERDDTLPSLRRALTSASAHSSELAVWALGRHGTAEARDALLDALVKGTGPDPSLIVRSLAGFQAPDSGVIKGAYRRLIDETHGRVQLEPKVLVASTTLSVTTPIGVDRAEGALRAIERRYVEVADRQDYRAMRRSLADFTSSSRLELPTSWVFTSPDPEWSERWARRLVTPFVALLERDLNDDRSFETRAAAVDLLTSLYQGDTPGSGEDLLGALRDLLGQEDPALRARAWRLTSRLATQDASALVEIYAPPQGVDVGRMETALERSAYALAVSRSTPDVAQPELELLLRDGAAIVRLAAARGVGAAHGSLASTLIDLLADPSIEVARESARALRRLADSESQDALERLHETGDPRSLLQDPSGWPVDGGPSTLLESSQPFTDPAPTR